MNTMYRFLIGSLLALAGLMNPPTAAQTAPMPSQGARPAGAQSRHLPIAPFVDAIGEDEAKALVAVSRIGKDWHDSSAAMLIEMVHLVPSRKVLAPVIALIEKASGRPFDGKLDPWYEWLWSTERPVHPDYAHFKALLYARIDARFDEYFEGRPKAIIRLDEIRWGGVRRDGIPPLKNPA